jgi:hypothetical protein
MWKNELIDKGAYYFIVQWVDRECENIYFNISVEPLKYVNPANPNIDNISKIVCLKFNPC